MGFFDQSIMKKIKEGAMPFRHSHGRLHFEKKKAMIKIVEDMEREDLIEPT